MSPILATEVLSLSGVIVLFVVLGAAAACFGKILPAILCLAVALVLLVVK